MKIQFGRGKQKILRRGKKNKNKRRKLLNFKRATGKQELKCHSAPEVILFYFIFLLSENISQTKK